MVSDKFMIKPDNMEKALDQVERIASCYFNTKEVLQVRLLTEETISVISPALAISDGRVWVTTSPGRFEVSVDCSANAHGVSAQTKKELLALHRPEESRGVFGGIRKILGSLLVQDADYNNYIGQNLITYGMGDMHGYTWNYNTYAQDIFRTQGEQAWLESTARTQGRTREESEAENKLEINIVAGYADDIKVFVQKAGKNKQDNIGPRLEITVVKNIPEIVEQEVEFA